MEEEWNNLFLHSLNYTVKTYLYTLYYTVKTYYYTLFYTIKTYCYTLFYTLFLSFTPLNYTLIRNSTLNKGGTNGVKMLFLHSLHSFPRYFSAKSLARKPSRKHAVVWWDALNESINTFSYSSVGIISVWFKKNQLLRLFHYGLGVFPSSLSQPGWGLATAELCTFNYRRFLSRELAEKPGPNSISKTKSKQTIK